MRVWIETKSETALILREIVTLRVRVWIETVDLIHTMNL